MTIYRSYIDKILTEFIFPVKKTKNAIIWCEGLPKIPYRKDLLRSWAEAGYAVFYPRYQGTWESQGYFLAKSPTKDVHQVINRIYDGFLTEVYGGKTWHCRFKKIIVIGESFGGAVALGLADDPRIAQVIALCPIVDVQKFHGNQTARDVQKLHHYLKTGYKQVYNFRNSDWNKFFSGKIFNPVDLNLKPVAEKISIIYTNDDQSLDPNIISSFVKKIGCKEIRLKHGGHGSMSPISHDINFILEQLK